MTSQTWREEFDNKFGEVYEYSQYYDRGDYYLISGSIKDFIETQISLAKAEMKAQCLAVIPEERKLDNSDKIQSIHIDSLQWYLD